MLDRGTLQGLNGWVISAPVSVVSGEGSPSSGFRCRPARGPAGQDQAAAVSRFAAHRQKCFWHTRARGQNAFHLFKRHQEQALAVKPDHFAFNFTRFQTILTLNHAGRAQRKLQAGGFQTRPVARVSRP
jgi:hypothetical protein